MFKIKLRLIICDDLYEIIGSRTGFNFGYSC
jgi:hypothetical protein